LALCDRTYEALTAASAVEMITFQGSNNVTVEAARANPLINNLAHNKKDYRQLEMYMRARGIVPLSVERR
ncbi:MAG: hypothetical protein H0U19_03640, partial [Acidobacteria bacterium]|nr:hypothetical protein [Acidobacteriota bacterium]